MLCTFNYFLKIYSISLIMWRTQPVLISCCEWGNCCRQTAWFSQGEVGCCLHTSGVLTPRTEYFLFGFKERNSGLVHFEKLRFSVHSSIFSFVKYQILLEENKNKNKQKIPLCDFEQTMDPVLCLISFHIPTSQYLSLQWLFYLVSLSIKW